MHVTGKKTGKDRENKVELTEEAKNRRKKTEQKTAINNANKAIKPIFQPTADFKSEDLC